MFIRICQNLIYCYLYLSHNSISICKTRCPQAHTVSLNKFQMRLFQQVNNLKYINSVLRYYHFFLIYLFHLSSLVNSVAHFWIIGILIFAGPLYPIIWRRHLKLSLSVSLSLCLFLPLSLSLCLFLSHTSSLIRNHGIQLFVGYFKLYTELFFQLIVPYFNGPSFKPFQFYNIARSSYPPPFLFFCPPKYWSQRRS